MLGRSIGSLGIAIFLICLLGPGAALATVKCQCNNGTITQNLGADFDDEDVEESCNDACSESGGGRVWRLDEDRENIYDSGDHDGRPDERPSPRRR